MILDSETEKSELAPAEVMLNRLPVMSPAAPMFILNKSPEAVAGVAGDQSRDIILPDERAVEVEDRLKPVPVDKESKVAERPVPVAVAEEMSMPEVPVVTNSRRSSVVSS